MDKTPSPTKQSDTRRGKTVFVGFIALVSTVSTAACGGARDEPSRAAPEPETVATVNEADVARYPRSIAVGGDEVFIEAQPRRIAALSVDVAEVTLALVDTDRITALPAANTEAVVGSNPWRAAQVAHQVEFGDVVSAATLAEWQVDLVLVSPNHTAERDLAQTLGNTAIPLLTMPNSWDSLEDAEDNILLIGDALGAEAAAIEIVEDMRHRRAAVAQRVDQTIDRPVVLALTNVAQVPFLIGPGVATTDLIEKAGGTSAAKALGVSETISAITTDQILTVNPEFILLLDGLGTGRAAFDQILNDPALLNVKAIKGGQVLVLPTRDTFGTAHSMVNGLEAIAAWIHPETTAS